MFSTLLSLIFKMFFPIVFAYVLFRKGIFNSETKKAITTIVMKCTVYFTIIMASQQEFSPEVGRILLQMAIFSAIYYLVSIPLMSLLGKKLGLSDDKRRVFISSIVFCNIAFVGFPVTLELYGETALLCAIIYDIEFSLFFFTYGMINLKSTKDISFKSVALNIYTILAVLALVFYFAQIKFPEPLYSTFSMLSSITMPLVMMMIGCLLAENGAASVIKDKSSYLPVIITMVILPLIVYVLMKLIGCSIDLIRVAVVITALPVGTMTSIICANTDCEPVYASNVLVLSNIVMLLTLPLWILIVR